jgi:hypothetical protein
MARGRKLVPECREALDRWKYEIASELGLPVGNASGSPTEEFAAELGSAPASSAKQTYWGHIASRDAGAVGGAITARLVRQAEQTLFSGRS